MELCARYCRVYLLVMPCGTLAGSDGSTCTSPLTLLVCTDLCPDRVMCAAAACAVRNVRNQPCMWICMEKQDTTQHACMVPCEGAIAKESRTCLIWCSSCSMHGQCLRILPGCIRGGAREMKIHNSHQTQNRHMRRSTSIKSLTIMHKQ